MPKILYEKPEYFYDDGNQINYTKFIPKYQ
jgi:hypothetical protein